MRAITADEMRELDRRTIEEHGTPGEVLMDRAGEGVALAAHELAVRHGLELPPVFLVAGKGNNGGDVFVVARYLHEMGYPVRVYLAGRMRDVGGDAALHMNRMKEAGVSPEELPDEADWDMVEPRLPETGLVVDGLLGTGSSGAPRGAVLGAIKFVNRLGERFQVVAVDLPSGVNADTGEVEGEAVVADLTVSMALPKVGLLNPGAVGYVGELKTVDIGIPEEWIPRADDEAQVELISPPCLRPLFPRRDRSGHKGKFGHVLLMGGARGYSGAIILSARAAMRMGSGLVSVLTPRSVVSLVAAACPEVMVTGALETDIGSFDSNLWDEWRMKVQDYDALLIGPGFTRHDESLSLVRRIIRDCSIPVIMDADAVTVLKGQPHWIEKAECDIVITPHPGELATLFGQEVADVQRDRQGMALAASKFTNATVVLKGAGTVVARIGRPVGVNMNGNPGMASAGMGDALAGMVTSLVGQDFEPYQAARAAVYVHGRAGDLAAAAGSQAGLITSDLIDYIPRAIRDVSAR